MAGTDEMRELYNEIDGRLRSIDAGELWPGFTFGEFALYSSDRVLLRGRELPRDGRFIGNTAINFEGRYIGIWNVENDYFGKDARDPDRLAAGLAHELFHAYQFTAGETRFPQDLKTLRCPPSAENCAWRKLEHGLLADAAEAGLAGERLMLLRRVCGIRLLRRALIGDYADCEFLSETAEGCAEFVGMSVLRKLSPEKFAATVAKYVAQLRKDGAERFDIRHSCYASGALFLYVLREAGEHIPTDLARKESVFDLALAQIGAEPAPASLPEGEPAATAELLDAELKSRRARIDAFANGAGERITGRWRITGYDPMNMLRDEDRILCSTFIALTDRETGEEKCFMGSTLLRMERGAENLVEAYVREKQD